MPDGRFVCFDGVSNLLGVSRVPTVYYTLCCVAHTTAFKSIPRPLSEKSRMYLLSTSALIPRKFASVSNILFSLLYVCDATCRVNQFRRWPGASGRFLFIEQERKRYFEDSKYTSHSSEACTDAVADTHFQSC
jgi:hypothetical protein